MWLYVTELLTLALTLFALAVVVIQRREPGVNLAWVLIVLFLPVIGPVLFFTLAWRRPERETRDFVRRAKAFRPGREGPDGRGDGAAAIEREDLRAIARAVERMGAPPARPGNRITFASDGATFRDMLLSSIRAAERSVHLEFYIYNNDASGREVTAALCSKAGDGVPCRLLLDAVGALWFDSGCLRRLRQAGVHVAFFHPTNPLKRRWQINYRMHRKIAVFDGQVALTGGRNIGDEYLGRRKGRKQWQDLSLRVRGPAVTDLQRVFLADWYYTTGRELAVEECGAAPETEGEQVVQVVPSHPHTLRGKTELAYLLAVRSARQTLHLVTPYFVPPASMQAALASAALSGVAVRIVVPGTSDSRLTLWAGRSIYRELIEAGVQIHEYQEGMLHGKLAIVDGQWCTAGSANLDCRSFRLSFEVNCLVYDREASGVLEDLFEGYRAQSVPVEDPGRYEQTLRDRLRYGVARLASPVL